MNAIRLISLLLFSGLLLSCGDNTNNAPTPPVEVDVALPLSKKIVDWDEYTGRFQAMEEVDVRSRVTGYLNEIKFKDGQFVKKGDVLFVIDPRQFDYALARATATLELAKKQYERALKLQKSSFISIEVIDQRFQEMQTATSQLNDAKLNLEFTQVTAPVSGKISHYFVSVGNLVTMNDTILTRIVSFDPIHFYFETSQNDLLKYIRLAKTENQQGTEINSGKVRIKLQDEKDFSHEGLINFVDNVVDQGTGTILWRAIVPNPDALIYPGFFGRARMIGSSEYQGLLLPDVAINTDQTRKYVYVVDAHHKVQRVYVELGPLRDSGFYVIRSGLKGNEQVVINGIQRIRAPEQDVQPKAITLSE